MFERNKIDNKSSHNVTASAVEITLDGGEIVHGRVHHSVTRPIGDELNGAGHFIDFEPFGQGRYWLTKRAVHILKLAGIPRADQIERGMNGPDVLNPYAVLKIQADADKDAIREAYHRMVRLYHPDRFANLELPPEMHDYVNAMARRVNLAYAALGGGKPSPAAPKAANSNVA